MIILGIADNHDSGAAVLIDGELVSAVNQERLDRVKSSGAFPWMAIDAALEIAGVKERDVDRIAVGTGFTPSVFLRAFPDLHHRTRKAGGQFSPLLHAYVVYQSAMRATGLHALELDFGQQVLQRRLSARPFTKAQVVTLDHHRSHAHGAYRTQRHDRCLVLTVDAMGDGTTATASIARGGQVEPLWRQSGLASVNAFYGKVTELLGFTANRHEGKITGLAAYVSPPADLVAHFKTRVAFKEPGFTRVSSRTADRADSEFWTYIAGRPREEVAAAAQRVLEEAVVGFVRHWVRKTGCAHVAVAGGTFANVKLNQRICEIDEVASLWVMPHMGDGGLAVGGGLFSAGSAPRRLRSASLGPEFSQRDCYKALKRGDLAQVNFEDKGPVEGVPGDVAEVARILEGGHEVACFQGRMEWGPRALGNRSVLARPDDPAVNQWLNDKLKRAEFMPFAPMVRAEDVGRFFLGTETGAPCLPFMTCCVNATAEFKRLAPAAVHVDGTCRPQLITAEGQPKLHALLGLLGERTGAPVLINTSFNMHEEPIVCSPSDAVRAFKDSRMAALWMGPYVVEQT